MVAKEKRVWVWHKKNWHKAVAAGLLGKKKAVRIDGKRVAVTRTFPQKHNGRVHRAGKTEVLPSKRVGPRLGRKRVPCLQLEAVAFQGANQHGDYRWQLRIDSEFYASKLHIYNENLHQQRDKCNNWAGGGNACARPYRPIGRSIGMPTGNHGGYSSLDEDVGNGETAKDTIDEAINEIINHVLANPGRFDTIYYCVNANDPSDEKDLIGMGIFHIDVSVRQYITKCIKSLPQRIAVKYETERRASAV